MKKNRDSPKTVSPSNIRILPPLAEKRQSGKPSFGAGADFSHLVARLEKRISRIESELKESVEWLENDIHKTLKAKKLDKEEKNVKGEIEALSRTLEARIRKSLDSLTASKAEPANRENLSAIRNLSSQLVKILSFDFYKSVLDQLTITDREEEIDPFGMDEKVVRKIKPVFDYLYYKYWRVATTGVDNIPNKGKALIVANHSGTLPYDGAMIKTAIFNEHPKRRDAARFLVEDFVFHMPILGSFMYRIGGVRACPENAELLLNSEHLVIVFPEGVKGIGKYYRQRYKLQRFGRGGFIKLCMKTKSPLVPVGVLGAEEIHPIIFKSNILAKTIGVPYIPVTPTFPLLGLFGCLPFPTKWAIHFGKPVWFESHDPSAIGDELMVHKLSEKVRGEIQQIILDLLRKRRSVLFG